MITQSGETIELFKIIINFLDENMFYFFIMFLTYLLRNALSDLIKRLTNLTFRNAESEVGITASSVLISERPVLEESDARSDNLVTEEHSVAIALEENKDKKNWYAALEEGDVETARTLFNEYESKEKDNGYRLTAIGFRPDWLNLGRGWYRDGGSQRRVKRNWLFKESQR